jgi:peptide/nickel transport system ATP-binding protein
VSLPRKLPPAPEPALVRAEHLSRYFDVSASWLARVLKGLPRQTVHAVEDVSFTIARGQTFALVGESGSGKSTLARLLVGLDRPTSGRIFYDGLELTGARSSEARRRMRHRMQIVFQDPYTSLDPHWRVFDIVAEPIRVLCLARSKAALRDRVAELLSLVRLSPDDGAKYPHQFSGGQRQRISIARALSSNPEFLICDEPTSALDVSVQAQIINLMTDLRERLGLTYLFISHNLALVRHIARTVGVMHLGSIVELGPSEAVLQWPLHPYTRLLLDAVPDLTMSGRPWRPLEGEPPNPLNPPPGCTFHPRCPLVAARCRRERPTPIQVGDSTVACHAVEEGRSSPW